MQAFPESAPQAQATTDLVNHLRGNVLPPFKHQTGVAVLVGGFTAGSIDFSNVLSSKLPLFLGLVILLSALLLFVIFRSLVIPIQAAILNLLTIGASLGATVAVFEQGYFASLFGVQKGPVEAWIPVIMFAVVFGLSMDYEVFLISRIREEWVRRGDASEAVAEGVAVTGRVISAAAAIMIWCSCRSRSATSGRSRNSDSASPWPSSSTRSSCGACCCPPRSSCWDRSRGACPAGSTTACRTSTSRARRRVLRSPTRMNRRQPPQGRPRLAE